MLNQVQHDVAVVLCSAYCAGVSGFEGWATSLCIHQGVPSQPGNPETAGRTGLGFGICGVVPSAVVKPSRRAPPLKSRNTDSMSKTNSPKGHPLPSLNSQP